MPASATPTSIPASFRALANAVARRQDHNFPVPELTAFFSALEASTDDEVDAWVGQLPRQPQYLGLFCRLYAYWTDGLLDPRFDHPFDLGFAIDDHTDDDEIEAVRQVIEAAYADAESENPSFDPGVEVVLSAVDEDSPVDVAVRVTAAAIRGTMLWDTCRLDLSDPVQAAIRLSLDCDRVSVSESSAIPSPKTGPLDRYHPERFMTWNPGMRGLASFARADGGSRSRGLTLEDLNHVLGTLMIGFNKRIMELPHAAIRRLPNIGGAPVHQAATLSSATVMWMAGGRQIFDLPPALVERFRQTDVDDVPLSMLHVPYPVSYLYWGVQPDIELAPGWHADGAYVVSQFGHLQVIITSSPRDANELAWTPIKGEPYAEQTFSKDELGMDVGTAVDEVLARDLKELREQAAKASVDVDAMMREMVDRGDIDPWAVPRHVDDVSPRSARQEIERLLDRHAGYKAALKLVINILCYLTAYPDDSDARYPDNAPADLVRATWSTDYKTAKRARGRLAELGYLPVHVCGKELERVAEGTHRGHGGHVRTHWRRGHWRRQAYGEGRALRKLIWLMPVVVGRQENDGEEPPGHLYLVS